MLVLRELFFLPPMAVARVGGSDTPVDAYEWVTDTDTHVAGRTVVRPALSLRVLPDGSVEPHLPDHIRFKDDGGAIRPVAPFFELWAVVRDAGTREWREEPLTLDLLDALGLTLQHLGYRVTFANRKAERRTGDASCAFVAEVEVAGDDHERHPLLAISPHTAGQTPLVPADQPICVGAVQVLRPVRGSGTEAADPSVLRLRFTPPTGQVYGPPTTTWAPASPVVPGLADAAVTEYGRLHEVVPPANRILSPDTAWSRYVMLTGQWEDSQPQDGYDGANVGGSRSWSVVDDTGDGVIEAHVAWQGRRFEALARVFTGPPDYAPDRRPIYSIADDLADRDLPPPTLGPDDVDSVAGDIADLFRRAFETASLFSLDAARNRAIVENLAKLADPPGPVPEAPKYDERSLTEADVPYVDVAPTLSVPGPPSAFSPALPNDPLPLSLVAGAVHGPLVEPAILLEFLRRRGDHVVEVVRPPFGTTSELPAEAPAGPVPGHRDPRVFADKLHDMRMPPYMRDANLYPLSISRRHHRLLRWLVEQLHDQGDRDDG